MSLRSKPERATRSVLALILLVLVAAPVRAQEASSADYHKKECLAAHESVQRARRAGSLLEAKRRAIRCAQPSCPNLISADCVTWAREIESAIPTVVLEAEDAQGKDVPGVTVKIDGKLTPNALRGRSTPVDPGPHTFRFEKRGEPAVEVEHTIQEGEKNRRIQVRLGPAPVRDRRLESRSRGGPPAGAWILGGVGILGIGAFATLAVIGSSERKDLDACKPNCDQADVDSARNKLIVADIALGVGVVSLGVATYLFLSAPSTKETASMSVRVGATHGAPVLSVDGRF